MDQELNSSAGPTAIDWARLAAFIDGEGHIAVRTQKPQKLGRTRRHFLEIKISNTDIRLMAWLKSTFGANFYLQPMVDGRKPVYQWIVNSCKAEEILRQCLPYFVIKRQHAEIGIAFQEYKSSSGGRGTGVLTDDVLLGRDSFVHEMKRLYGSTRVYSPPRKPQITKGE